MIAATYIEKRTRELAEVYKVMGKLYALAVHEGTPRREATAAKKAIDEVGAPYGLTIVEVAAYVHRHGELPRTIGLTSRQYRQWRVFGAMWAKRGRKAWPSRIEVAGHIGVGPGGVSTIYQEFERKGCIARAGEKRFITAYGRMLWRDPDWQIKALPVPLKRKKVYDPRSAKR